jgi:hypothetical protein
MNDCMDKFISFMPKFWSMSRHFQFRFREFIGIAELSFLLLKFHDDKDCGKIRKLKWNY